jgi:hypothetical protein
MAGVEVFSANALFIPSREKISASTPESHSQNEK